MILLEDSRATKMKWIIFGITLTIYNCIGQDILFPGEKHVPHATVTSTTTSTTTATPLSPSECPDNMTRYGNATDGTCDCLLRFLYFPRDDKCYEAYLQGPCKMGEYVVLPQNELIPKCEKNPCLKNGLVMYNNGCYLLNKKGSPCDSSESLAVNETTFKVECIDLEVKPFMIITAPQRKCPAGSRRNVLGVCKEVA